MRTHIFLLALLPLWAAAAQPPSVQKDSAVADITKSTSESYEKEKAGAPKQEIAPAKPKHKKEKAKPQKQHVPKMELKE